MSKSTPLEILNLPDNATLPQIKARWRTLASTHHPDHGGDAEIFNTIRQAYHYAIKNASSKRDCPQCHGVGKTRQGAGFNAIFMVCTRCAGAGVV